MMSWLCMALLEDFLIYPQTQKSYPKISSIQILFEFILFFLLNWKFPCKQIFSNKQLIISKHWLYELFFHSPSIERPNKNITKSSESTFLPRHSYPFKNSFSVDGIIFSHFFFENWKVHYAVVLSRSIKKGITRKWLMIYWSTHFTSKYFRSSCISMELILNFAKR